MNLQDNAKGDPDLILELRDIEKTYQVYRHPRDKFKQALMRHRRRYYESFQALIGVSFSLRRGEVMGVIGRNGSGKSTLLKLICGTVRPSKGEIRVHGRIGALLELGSGFDPEFSGLDNVFMNAALLGLSDDQTRQRLDDILSFADIGGFIDQPVKTYSSGMAMRLAFAIQAQTDPDLLVVDEALAVGDEIFQRRCMQRLQELRDAGTAILLVTHHSQSIVQHCNRALLLVKGRMRLLDNPKTVIRVYERLGYEPESEWDALLARIDQLINDQQPQALLSSQVDKDLQITPPSCVRYEARGAEVISVDILDAAGKSINVVPFGASFAVRLHYRVDRLLPLPTIGSNISNRQGVTLAGKVVSAWDRFQWLPAELDPGLWTATFNYQGGLLPGLYFVGASISSGRPPVGAHKVRDACMFRISAAAELSCFGYVDLVSDRITLSRSEGVWPQGLDQS